MKPIKFEVHGLFGRREPVILDLTNNATIVYGINGSGKTTVLKLLNAILSGRLYEIRNFNFKSLLLVLDDNSGIKATRTKKKHQDDECSDRAIYELKIQHIGSNKKVIVSAKIDNEAELSERLPTDRIEMDIPELNRIGRREWHDTITGDILNEREILERYSDRLPWLQLTTEIDWYRNLIKGFSVKLIQTQRLMTLKTDMRKYHSRGGARYQNTVIEYSDRLTELIRDRLSESMHQSQSLDSSYPKRLLRKGSSGRLSDKKLLHLVAETERLGNKLRNVNLLPKGDSIDITLKSISEDNRRAIGLYLSDSVEKYTALEPFADKLLLFLDIVNSKFNPRKTVEVGGHEGIRIGLANGDSIHPRHLSSGEQHEIVLLFDLIFFSKPGTLVLIDEPEISLHIDWQKTFLSDVEAIGNAADLKFLLATHSPAIIGNRVDICEEI